jgi:hypothetical protein
MGEGPVISKLTPDPESFPGENTGVVIAQSYDLSLNESIQRTIVRKLDFK